MKNLKLERPIVFLDFETTSTDVSVARIVQYALIKIFPQPEEPQRISEGFLNPGVPIPPETSKIHGITDDMVKDALTFKDLAERFSQFIDNCDFGGFNILNYDLPVLKNEFQRCGIKFDYSRSNVVDVMALFYHFNPRDLSAAYQQYCQKTFEAHDALNDTKATIEVLEYMLDYHQPFIELTVDEVEKITFDQQKYVDRGKKFSWDANGEACFTFGKHANKSLRWVKEHAFDYLRWILSGSFSDEVKKICKSALYDNEFPQKKQGD